MDPNTSATAERSVDAPASSGARFDAFLKSAGQDDGRVRVPSVPKAPSERSPTESSKPEPVAEVTEAPAPSEPTVSEDAPKSAEPEQSEPEPKKSSSGADLDPEDLEQLRRLGISDELLGEDAPEPAEAKPDMAALLPEASRHYHKHGGDAVKMANELHHKEIGIQKKEQMLQDATDHFKKVVEALQQQASARTFDEAAAYKRHLDSIADQGWDAESAEAQELARHRAANDKQKFQAELPSIPEDISTYVENLAAKREAEQQKRAEHEAALETELRTISKMRDGSANDLFHEWTVAEFFKGYTDDPAELKQASKSSFEEQLSRYLVSEGASTPALQAAIRFTSRRAGRASHAPAETPPPPPAPEPLTEHTPAEEIRNHTKPAGGRDATSSILPHNGGTFGSKLARVRDGLLNSG